MKIEDERYFASLVGVYCKVEIIHGDNHFEHDFSSNIESVYLNILEGEYRPGLFTCWMACVYKDRIKITPLEPPF